MKISLPFVTAWMDLENIMLIHRRQTQGPQAKSGPPPCFILPRALFLPGGSASYVYTVLKLHSAL